MNKYKPCLLIRQLLLASTLSAGFGTLWFLFVLIACTLVVEVWAGPETNWPPREELVVKTDGTLLVKSTPRGNPLSVSYRDLSGRAVPTPSAAELIEGTYLMGGSMTHGFSPMGLDPQTRLKVFADRQQPGVLWYFLHNGAIAGAGYFVGFDRANNARVGFVGESGFRADRPPPGEQFPVESSLMELVRYWSPAQFDISQGSVIDLDPNDSPKAPSWVLVPSGNRLRLVDLSTQSVRTAFQSTEPIESFGFFKRKSSGDSESSLLVVRNAREIVVLNGNLDVIRTWTIPAESQDAFLITWYELGDARALIEIGQAARTERGTIAPRIVYQVGSDGTTQTRAKLALQSGMQLWSKQRTAAELAYAMPAPLVLPLVELPFVNFISQPQSFAAAVRSMLEGSWPGLLAVVGLGLLLAIAAWLRARAFGLPAIERAAWVVFVFLFGLPGYVGYRLHRRWPFRVECPHCHARPPRDRTECAACRSPFPAPAEQGIEVFA